MWNCGLVNYSSLYNFCELNEDCKSLSFNGVRVLSTIGSMWINGMFTSDVVGEC